MANSFVQQYDQGSIAQLPEDRMRRLLTISFLLPLLLQAQYRRYMVGPSEYFNCLVDRQTGKGYTINGVATWVSNISNASWCASGPHSSIIVDASGNCWSMGLNANGELGLGSIGGTTSTFAQITVDSAGNPFTNVVQVYGGLGQSGAGSGWAYIALKSDGTVWAWGALYGGMSGNTLEGNRPRPVQVVIPGGVLMKKLQFCVCIFGLDVSGNVWSWGGNNGEFQIEYLLSQKTTSPAWSTPTKVGGLKSPIRDIAAGKYWCYAITATGDSIYANGKYSGPLGIATAHQLNTPGIDQLWPNSSQPQFIWIDNYLNLPARPKMIECNTTTTTTVLKNGQLWAWGDNTAGGCAQGHELNYATYVTPWQGPFDVGDTTEVYPRPVQIYPGKNNWDTIFTCKIWTFNFWAEDSTGRVFFWGRQKGGVGGNQMVACDMEQGSINGNWPNWADVLYPEPLDSLFNGSFVRGVPQGCYSNPTSNNCNISNCSTAGNQNPVARMTLKWSRNTITWDATGATDDHHIMRYKVTQVSGPSDLLGCLACKTNTFSYSNIGNRSYKIVVTDNMQIGDSTIVSMTVGALRVHGTRHIKLTH